MFTGNHERLCAPSIAAPVTKDPNSMDMSITEVPGPVSCVRLSGRLDAAAADELGVRFTAATASLGRPAIVDLTDVSFVASMGLRLLISSARALSSKGQKMALFGATGMTQETLDNAGIDKIVPVVGTQDEALAAVKH